MDSDSSIARVERTFWTVWNYITGAVNRFLRPEPTHIVSNDPSSLQESVVDSEAANCGLTEEDTCRGKGDEEQSLQEASLLISSRPVVSWEICTTDIDLGPDKESMQYKTQLSRGGENEASEEGECTREEQLTQTGNDDADLLITKNAETKEDEREEKEDLKLGTPGQDGCEKHANSVLLNITDDAMSESLDESGRKAGAEEEADRAMTLEDQQKMDETVTNIQVQEEDREMQHEVEQDFKYSYTACSAEAEETEVKLCTLTNLSLEEEDYIHVEEEGVQRCEAEMAVTPEEEENSDGVLQLSSENENNRQAENVLSVCEEFSDVNRDFEEDPSVVSSDTVLMAYDKTGTVSENDRSEEIVYDKVEGEKEEIGESAVNDEEHVAVIEEGNGIELKLNNQITDEVPEQENNIETVTEDIITERVACSEDFTQNATTELHKAEFTDREQEDVASVDTKVQTGTRETDDVEMKSHGTVMDEKSDVDGSKAEAEEERFSSEDDNEDLMEIACAAPTVTVKPDAKAGQEISGEFKNIPPGIYEGQAVVSKELNSTTREETQEAVPEYNNESGPDENTTQRLLEGGDDEEIQTTQLPEEVESEEPESIQNSGNSGGSDHLLLTERMETEQDSRLTTTEDRKNSFDEEAGILSVIDAQESEKPLAEPVIQESGHLFVQEEGQLLNSSMKTGILEKEFETHVGTADDKTTKEQEDGTEELLVEFEVDEGLCDSSEADAAGGGHETTGAAEDVARFAGETLLTLDVEVQNLSFYNELANAINSTSRTFDLLGDVTEPEFLTQSRETEPILIEDCTAEMQDATIEVQVEGIDMEETSYGLEEEVAEDETQDKNETEILNFQVAEMAPELTTDTDKKENALTGRSESSPYIKAVPEVTTLETEVQLSYEAPEEMLTDTETAEDSMTTESSTTMSTDEMAKHESDGSYAEERGSSISGPPDVIDEEILDLWIQAALSEETVGTKQQEQQMDTDIEPSNEDQDEMQSEKEKEQLVESNSLESGLVSDTEIPSSTPESGFLYQSLGEWGTQNSETELLKSASTESFQGIGDMLASILESADVSELSIKQPASEPQDLLIEVTAEASQSYLKEEESITVTDQESDELQEKTEEERVELAETGTASQRETDAEVTYWKDPEDADVKTNRTSLFEVEQANVQDEPLEINVSDSPNEIHSGQSRSDSEASLDEGIELTDSGLQGENSFESGKKLQKLPSLEKPEALQSEEIAESSSGLNGAEVAEQPSTKSEDQMEVDASVLDFTAQKSRIAVKNPHVRPPKDPRSLLHMPSVDPTPSTRPPVKVPAGVPLGGLGIGIKLPGFGAGFPVLKKTQRVARDENNPETSSQESERKPEEKDDTPKQDEVQQKPKWMPPRHPGFGNPLMSELKTKLKKTTKE